MKALATAFLLLASNFAAAEEGFDHGKEYPKEIKKERWAAWVQNPLKFDYDEWDTRKFKQVHFFKEEGIAIYANKNGDHIWSHDNIQSNVKLIDKKLGLYIVTTYHMDNTGMFVNPSVSPVQMKTNREIGKAAYDKMWNDNWLWNHCLSTAYDRMLEMEEGENEGEND